MNKPPLRPVLVEGKWERMVIRQVPVPIAGATVQCRNVQFG